MLYAASIVFSPTQLQSSKPRRISEIIFSWTKKEIMGGIVSLLQSRGTVGELEAVGDTGSGEGG